MGDTLLRLGSTILENDQKLYIAGASDEMADRNICWSTKADGIKEMAIELTSNAEEADTRVWLHGQLAMFCFFHQTVTSIIY